MPLGTETTTHMSATPLLPGPIGFVLIPQFAVIALASAIEPLRIANRYLQTPYTWRLLSLDGQAVPDGNGILIQPHGCLHDEQALGTVILCADLQPDRHYSKSLRAWLQRMNAQGASLGALDTGCFLLARAGLLDGHRVTMHWEVIDAFRERFPKIVVAQTLFEVGAQRLTCAGGTATIDMMLHAIAIDHGQDLAQRVAEHCLHDHMRSGDVGQRLPPAARMLTEHPALACAMQLLDGTLDRPVGLLELADHAGLSTRQLQRLFAKIMGEGPGQYHRRLRLERARSLLHNTATSVTETAVAVGFESVSHFCRAYRQQYGQVPTATRRSVDQRKPLMRDQVR